MKSDGNSYMDNYACIAFDCSPFYEFCVKKGKTFRDGVMPCGKNANFAPKYK